MVKSIFRGALCSLAVLCGCGAQAPTSEQPSALTSTDISGLQGCSGTFQLPQTYDGLVGQYLRSNLTTIGHGDIMTLDFETMAPIPQSPKVTGSYLANDYGTGLQSGTYVALESNPLIGSLLTLTPTGSSSSTTLAIIGLRRDSLGNVSALCISSDNEGNPFELDRF